MKYSNEIRNAKRIVVRMKDSDVLVTITKTEARFLLSQWHNLEVRLIEYSNTFLIAPRLEEPNSEH